MGASCVARQTRRSACVASASAWWPQRLPGASQSTDGACVFNALWSAAKCATSCQSDGALGPGGLRRLPRLRPPTTELAAAEGNTSISATRSEKVAHGTLVAKAPSK